MLDHEDAITAAGKYDDTDTCKYCLKHPSRCACTPESIERQTLQDKLRAFLEAV